MVTVTASARRVSSPSPSHDALEHVPCNLCGNDAPRSLFLKHGFTVVRCRRCGLAYVTPRPRGQELAGIYRGETYYRNSNACAFGYGDYLADAFLLQPLFARRLTRIETLRPARGRLLDVGCATGLLLEEARRRGWETEGVEPSDFAADVCRRRSLHVHHGDLTSARFAPAHFEVAVMDDTVEHLPDPRRELEELHRVLVPGGLLTLNTANESGLLRLLMGRYWFHYKPIEHLYYFGPGTLSALLTETGFRVLSYRLSGKIVTFRYLCARLRAYSPLASRLLLATFARASVASRPFFLPIGEFVIFAERC